MGKPKKSSKVRTSFRRHHQGRARQSDLTREFTRGDAESVEDALQHERVSGKGDLTRQRTVKMSSAEDAMDGGFQVALDVAGSAGLSGRVLSAQGLHSRVLGDDGTVYSCATRQLLKNLSTDQRHVVAAGDRVAIRTQPSGEGIIEKIEPRYGVLSRTSKGQRHVIATNVDQVLIVVSLAEPGLKPNLIDRFLLTAEQARIEPIICFNKVDLVDATDYQQIVGVFAQAGYTTVMTSAATGRGVEFLRHLLTGSETAVAGQSGVGKSSLLNAIEPDLGLRVNEVSRANEKGKHTTTTAALVPLAGGGFVIDTPGIRQFQLWDISASEVASLMPDFRPYVAHCRYPNCLHLEENGCAIKDAVADARLDPRRYDGYCHLLEEELRTGR